MSWVWSKPEIRAVVGLEAPRSFCAELTFEPDFLSQYTLGHYLPLLYVVKWYLGSTQNVAPFKKQPYWYFFVVFFKEKQTLLDKSNPT